MRERFLSLSSHSDKQQVMWAHSEMVATFKPREATSEWNYQAGTLIIYILASRMVRNKFLLCKPLYDILLCSSSRLKQFSTEGEIKKTDMGLERGKNVLF